jgi:tetratricopeptide (TPR) repeat protein
LSSTFAKASMRPGMNIRKFATITVLVLSSFAANNVAPTKAELESMYDKAFREFNANNYPQALLDLDAIDARQPDLAESHNLRGVILMRQAQYDQAETSLQKALATDAKFWNARFNLAEIPFLRKNWAEARKRFEGLLQGNAAELQGEAAQLIQYKILLTYLLEGKENMVDSMLAKFELSPETPAAYYANAAVSLQHKNEKEAKDWLAKAEKSFSPQLNKLFAESLYEVGWMQKPAGQTRVALELTTAADRQAKAKAIATEKLDQAEQAFQQRDLTAARKLVDEADAANPNQAATINLRGEILLAQKDFDGAENAFKQAVKADPNFHEAQFNLAQIPFKKKDYTKARDRFEALFAATPAGGDKNQASQIIKFKIFLTLLLEGKDARAQKMMEQFQFTGDTPALYYAQAAWEFKHSNGAKANDWIVSARKIYSPALNLLFADSFYDLGWLENRATAPATTSTEVAKVEATPAIEPSPIPSTALAMNKKQPAEQKVPAEQKAPVEQKAPATVPGMEATTGNTTQAPPASQAVTTKTDKAAPLSSPKVETPVVSNALPAETRAPLPKAPEQTAQVQASPPNVPATSAAQENPVNPPVTSAAITESSPPNNPASAPANKVAPAAATTPATVLAPATVREWSQPTFGERMARLTNGNTLLIGLLLFAGIALLAWVAITEVRRRLNVSVYPTAAPAMGPRFAPVESPKKTVAPVAAKTIEKPAETIAAPARIVGGPPQVSLQLKASEPSVRRAAVPFSKMNRPPGVTAPPVPETAVESFVPRETAPVREPETALPTAALFAEPAPAPFVADVPKLASAPEWEFAPAAKTDFAPKHEEYAPALKEEEPGLAQAPAAIEAPVAFETPAAFEASAPDAEPAKFEAPPTFEEPVMAEMVSEPVMDETPAFVESVSEPVSMPPEIAEAPVIATAARLAEPEIEPVAQVQPIPYQVPAFTDSPMAEITKPEPETPARVPEGSVPGTSIAGIGALRQSVESPSFAPQVISTEPLAQQPTTPATMPQPTQPTPAPAIRPAPMTGAAPQSQPASGMQTAVQLTFSFEIASLQLTPSFKMGALQLKPTSKIVTMRLAPSQQPQPAMNLQVTFEVASVQLAGNSLGMIRLTPSQQQRPSVISSPAFNIAGLQLMSGDSGAVQLTPSQQGQASVHVTGRFQIATVEFSPSFEIASIVLNSTSKSVSVQLPGAGPSAVEGAPVFDIANVQLGGNGEIGMMQLTAQGAAPKPA